MGRWCLLLPVPVFELTDEPGSLCYLSGGQDLEDRSEPVELEMKEREVFSQRIME